MRAALLTIVLVAACSWNRFDDLSERAPVREIAQGSNIFADDLRAKGQLGALVVAAAGGASFTTSVITEKGVETESTQTVSNTVHIDAMARGSTGPGSSLTPLLWVSAEGLVRQINPYTGQDPWQTGPTILNNEGTWSSAPRSLGRCLGVAALGGAAEASLDLVAGAEDALVLMKLQTDGWHLDKVHVMAGLGAGSGRCSIAAADAGDLLAAGLPATSQVGVIPAPKTCFEVTGCTPATLPAPADADGFGTAVAIGDFDPAAGDELLVGAPGAGKVFVYSVSGSPATFTLRATISAPGGAGEFGAALALGRLYGSDHLFLVVGAPATTVDGVSRGGALYLYESPGAQPQQISLSTPRAESRLGTSVQLVRFQRPDEAEARSIIGAASLQSVYLFFADPRNPDRGDVRVP
jgi:hypothetical protein